MLRVVNAPIWREFGNDDIHRVKGIAGHYPHGEKIWFHAVDSQ
jgi:hypothetical protein